MSPYRYLQPEQHYIDLYDKFTIEECRDIESGFNEKAKLPNKQGLNEKEVRAAADIAIHISIYCCSGERALKKNETIREWMERFEKKESSTIIMPFRENILDPFPTHFPICILRKVVSINYDL